MQFKVDQFLIFEEKGEFLLSKGVHEIANNP